MFTRAEFGFWFRFSPARMLGIATLCWTWTDLASAETPNAGSGTVTIGADGLGLELKELIIGLLLPLLVGILSYLVQCWLQRRALRCALLSEINLLLRSARDYQAYLSRTDHFWLREGSHLLEAPVFTATSLRAFEASVTQFFLLPSKEMRKILSFYSAYEETEKLIEILFGRIAKQVGQPLSAVLVDGSRKRADRILENLKVICDCGPAATLASLDSLKDDYALATAGSVADGFRKRENK